MGVENVSCKHSAPLKMRGERASTWKMFSSPQVLKAWRGLKKWIIIDSWSGFVYMADFYRLLACV